jgi:uncharacterized membrane protein YphA (DoxX/SURF4 family)
MRFARLAQGLFAVAFASLAIWSLAYGEFPWAAPSLLAGIPWRQAWVYGSALIILAASAGLCVPRTALPCVVVIAVCLALRAAISVPEILAKPLGFDTWYPFCEALTPLAAAWILYVMLRRQRRESATPIASRGAVRTAQVLFGLTCVFYGWSHFAYAGYTAAMVPVWLPGHLALAYLTGVGHVAAGLAIIVGILPRLAATLEASMMSLFGLLVWVPSFFAQPRPDWATPPEQQWSELVVTAVVAAAAWVVAVSLENRPWSRLRGK